MESLTREFQFVESSTGRTSFSFSTCLYDYGKPSYFDSKVVDAGMLRVPMKVLQRMESIRCHFFNGVDHNDGKLGKNVNHIHPSIWLDIVREMEQLKNQGTDLIGFIHKKMGNEADTSFGRTCGGGWGGFWSLEGSGEFSIASVRRLIDERWLSDVLTKTRWINVVPIKVNVHAWKVREVFHKITSWWDVNFMEVKFEEKSG
ncbi:hypothetical protein Tco_0382705 [Tanacetum coccineum]